MTMFERARKGITPIIAIVLLLMMTVAAAGGAYAWLTQLQDQFQNRAQENLNRGISIVDLQCYNDQSESQGYVEVFFKNTGSAELDLDPMDMNVRSVATGNINFDLTRTGFSLAFSGSSPEESRINAAGNFNSDFSAPGESSAYQIEVGSSSGSTFTVGDNYEVTFVFTDEDGTTNTATCQAETRS